MKYRPWGPIDWILSLSRPKKWAFIGVIGTEERSLSSWEHIQSQSLILNQSLFHIEDIFSEKYHNRIETALNQRYRKISDLGIELSSIHKLDLLVEQFRIKHISNEIAKTNQSVILDITSFPKRFFFPILKILTESSNVKNLLITYTSPSSYSNENLYEDIEEWKILPGFGELTEKPDLWIVSIGFLVESLAKYIGGNPDEKMNALIPFPASLAVLRRTWESVAKLEEKLTYNRLDKYRVETLDISAAFDRINSLAGKPEKRVAFAPFGPKPTSAAMCLYAIQRTQSTAIHYAQPLVYHPEYSIGSVAVNAYWIKHDGEFLYAI